MTRPLGGAPIRIESPSGLEAVAQLHIGPQSWVWVFASHFVALLEIVVPDCRTGELVIVLFVKGAGWDDSKSEVTRFEHLG